MSKPDGGPVFPTHWQNTSDLNSIAPNGKVVPPFGMTQLRGMSLRDYFAAAVLPAVYSEVCKQCEQNGWPHDWRKGIADNAYSIADAMLERSKP